MLKKLNAIVAWGLIVCLLAHLITMDYSLLTGWYDFTTCKSLAKATACITIAHVLLCIFIFFFFHDGTKIGKYGKMNKNTIMQRASGIGILLLVHIHVTAFGFIAAGEPLSIAAKIWLIITEVIFFDVCLMHLSVSFSKSLITMGVLRSEAVEKKINLAARIITFSLEAITVIALVRFVINWP